MSICAAFALLLFLLLCNRLWSKSFFCKKKPSSERCGGGGGEWHRWGRGLAGAGETVFFYFLVTFATTFAMHTAPQKDPENVRRSCCCLFCIRVRHAAAKKAAARARRGWNWNGVRPAPHVRQMAAVGRVDVRSCLDLNMDLACSEALRSRRPR